MLRLGPHMTQRRAFGYLRLSRDRDTSTSIDKQRASVEDLCRGRSWELVDVFEDVDISGRRESRPGLDAMLERLDDADAVVFHRLDRIMRSVLGFAKLLERCQRAGVELVSATEPFDTSTAIGRVLVWLLAAIAEIEAENTSLRIRATQEHMARLGRPSHDARAFGRWKDPVTGEWAIREDEAEVLRKAAAELLSGKGLQTICDGLNNGSMFGRVVTTVRGSSWAPTTLSRMLRSPRMLGYAIRHGRPTTDEPPFPAILDVETFEAVDHELRRRSTFKQRYTSSDSELTGLVRCETCGARMYVNTSHGKRGYVCNARAGHKARIPKLWLEAEVARRFFEWVDDQQVAAEQRLLEDAEPEPDPTLRATLSRLEWGRDELLRDYYQEGRVERAVFEEQLADLTERIERVREKFDAHEPRPPLERVLRRDFAEVWPAMTTEERRAVFAACIDRVVVKPAGYRGQQPHPGRVEVVWHP